MSHDNENPIERWETDDADLPPLSPASLPTESLAASLLARQLARRVIDRDPAWIPPEPKPPYLGGILGFPFYPTSLLCLLVISAFTGLLGWTIVMASPDGDLFGRYGLMLTGSFAQMYVPAMLVLLPLLGSVAAAYWLAIVHETAHGYDSIHHWPSLNMPHWLLSFLQMLWVAVVSAALPLLLHWLIPVMGPKVVVAGTWLVAPVVMLSVLEANCPWVVLSPVVLRSLVSGWYAWLCFYVAAALIAAAWLAAVAAVLTDGNLRLILIVAGPVTGAISMVYARALGRLSWYLGRLSSKAQR